MTSEKQQINLSKRLDSESRGSAWIVCIFWLLVIRRGCFFARDRLLVCSLATVIGKCQMCWLVGSGWQFVHLSLCYGQVPQVFFAWPTLQLGTLRTFEFCFYPWLPWYQWVRKANLRWPSYMLPLVQNKDMQGFCLQSGDINGFDHPYPSWWGHNSLRFMLLGRVLHFLKSFMLCKMKGQLIVVCPSITWVTWTLLMILIFLCWWFSCVAQIWTSHLSEALMSCLIKSPQWLI